MSLVQKIRRNRTATAGRRDLFRTLAKAPTPASRDELLGLAAQRR